jgi:Outer membrane lipoprotein carrier protein LolA-like
VKPSAAAAPAGGARSNITPGPPLGRRGTKCAVGVSLACALAMAQPPIRSEAASITGVADAPASGAVTFIVATATATEAAGESSPAALDQVLRLLAARRTGHVSFTEVHTLAMLDRPLESSGELRYEAPDHLEKRTLQPKPETLLLEHGVLTARRGHRTWVMSLRDFPQVVPFVESIRATLAGDRGALERFFTLTFSGTVERWSLVLVPKDATVAHVVKEIRIEGERDAVHTVRITQTDGDASVMTIGREIGP